MPQRHHRPEKLPAWVCDALRYVGGPTHSVRSVGWHRADVPRAVVFQALWSNGQGTSTRVHRDGWQHWVYLEDLVYEGTLGEDWAAPSKTQSEELWEAVLPSDSLLVVILAKLDSPLSLERRAAARLLLINFRDHKHKEVVRSL
jgi:hypothetical protein